MLKQIDGAKVYRCAKGLAREADGSVAILFGLCVIILSICIGLAIDSARVYATHGRIQRALDTAALAAAKKLDNDGITAEQVKNTASNYFNAQIEDQLLDNVTVTNINSHVDFESGSVKVTVDFDMPIHFGAIAKAQTRHNATLDATAIYKPKKIELALVVDITGSMCDIAPRRSQPPCTSGFRIDALKDAAKEMVDQLHESNPAPGAVRMSLIPYSASVKLSPQLANAATNGDSNDGCVVERKGQKAYSNDPPGPGRFFETSSQARNSSYSCPANPVVPLGDMSEPAVRNAFKSSIDALTAKGGTAGHLGAGWGWYTLSPDWAPHFPDIEPRDYDPDKVTKVVVLMTDGMFNTAYNNGGENYVWPDASREDPSSVGSSSYQLLRLCEKMRNPSKSKEQIQLYSISFQAPAAAEAVLTQCTGAERFYSASSASDLIRAFSAIAEELSKLRVSS